MKPRRRMPLALCLLIWVAACGATSSGGEAGLDASQDSAGNHDGWLPETGTEASALDVTTDPIQDAGPTDGPADVLDEPLECDAGSADCDANPTNGCEADLGADPDNCGACGLQCAVPANTIALCAAGTCSGSVCSTGYADCNGDITDGCEAELGFNPLNCGACGLICEQTACWNGQCAPDKELVASSASFGSANWLVLDATHVYWTAQGGVVSRAKSGGPSTLLATNTYQGALAGAEGYLYYVGDDGLYRLPTTGGAPTKLLGETPSYTIATDGQHVYWLRVDGIQRIPVTGGAPEEIVSSDTVTAFTVHAGYLYWFSNAGPGVARTPLDGGPTTLVANAQYNGAWVAVQGPSVMWLEYQKGPLLVPHIRRAPASGGPSETLISIKTNDQLGDLAADSTHIYYENDYLTRIPISGGVPRVVLPGVFIKHMDLDDTHVYWTDYPSGDVYRIVKP